MEKPIEVKQGGLMCDNPKCDYVNNIPSTEYPQWVNRPCPKCGENLLTESDYRFWKILMFFVRILNKILPKPKVDDEAETVSVHYHNGKLEVKRKES